MATPPEDPSGGLLGTEAVLLIHLATAFVGAVLGMLIAFGVELDGTQKASIILVVELGLALASALWARRHVFSKRSAAELAAASARAGRPVLELHDAREIVARRHD